MSHLVTVAVDLVAIALLITIYVRRHRRRDLVLAYLTVNVGVLAVTQVLATSAVGAGLGLGLFGVLSIIRLRSSEIAQHEVAYYFAALAMGLLAGFQDAGWVSPALIALVVAAMYAGDHPRFLRGYRQQVVVLDHAVADERSLRDHLEVLLGGPVTNLAVQRLDLVNDSTVVDVRYRLPATRPVPADDRMPAGLPDPVRAGWR